jgi:nitrate reductase NapD
MDDTVHIASLLVHCRPELLPALLANLQCLPDVELHQHSAEGKLVVVLETGHERQILERIEQLQQLPGVLNVALIYHELLSPEGATA